MYLTFGEHSVTVGNIGQPDAGFHFLPYFRIDPIAYRNFAAVDPDLDNKWHGHRYYIVLYGVFDQKLECHRRNTPGQKRRIRHDVADLECFPKAALLNIS